MDPGADRGEVRRSGRGEWAVRSSRTGARRGRSRRSTTATGRITDDTLMVARAGARLRQGARPPRRLRRRRALVPEISDTSSGSPSWRSRPRPLQRLFLAEKWLVLRLHHANVDPREAGVGNIVNCGAAMYMAPVGVLNAGRPAGGVRRGHRGRRGPPVQLRPRGGRRVRRRGRRGDDARGDPPVGRGRLPRVAHDGTAAAVEAVCSVAEGHPHWSAAAPALRAAVRRSTPWARTSCVPAWGRTVRAGCTRSRAARGAGTAAGGRRGLHRDRARSGQLRPRLGLHRQHGRRDRRCARRTGRGAVRVGDRGAEGSRTDLIAPADEMVDVTARSSTGRAASRGAPSRGRCPREVSDRPRRWQESCATSARDTDRSGSVESPAMAISEPAGLVASVPRRRRALVGGSTAAAVAVTLAPATSAWAKPVRIESLSPSAWPAVTPRPPRWCSGPVWLRTRSSRGARDARARLGAGAVGGGHGRPFRRVVREGVGAGLPRLGGALGARGGRGLAGSRVVLPVQVPSDVSPVGRTRTAPARTVGTSSGVRLRVLPGLEPGYYSALAAPGRRTWTWCCTSATTSTSAASRLTGATEDAGARGTPGGSA